MTAVGVNLRVRREGVLRSRAARGDAAAFAAVYERHHQALYRYCRSILRHEEDAQDALQSTMTKAFAALQTEQRDFELRPWLFKIAHNEAISILRRRRETTELGDVPELGAIEDRVLEREELRALQMDLADLPDRQRTALVLRELSGFSHAEIAVVLESTPTAVKHTIFEARSALFSCREGREMGCPDVRRMLSDGDGRILRGRGVRAHLRSCPDCRRFRADLEQRPVALRMLAPPLPAAAAATLFSSLLGGSAAKLLTCVAIAGGGTTLAVEVQMARQSPKGVAIATPTPKPKSKPPRRETPKPKPKPAVTPAPVAVAPVQVVSAKVAPPPHAKPKPKRAKPHHAKKKPVGRAAAARKSARPPGLARHKSAKAEHFKHFKQAKAKRFKAKIKRWVAKVRHRVAKVRAKFERRYETRHARPPHANPSRQFKHRGKHRR